MLSSVMKACSRNRAGELILNGEVNVNGRAKKPGYKLKPGDLIEADIPDQIPADLPQPEEISLDILYEDDHVIVINKAAGMVVHPAPGNLTGTLVNALIYHYPQIVQTCEDPLRPGIVHRLDKDTTGAMVIAKKRRALEFLQKEFENRRVEKRYLALAAGIFTESRGEINLPVGRHPVKRKLMAVNHETGKPAVTLWELKTQYKEAACIEALLKTGRTHQIRLHFYAIDHPLIGDQVYQPRRYRKKISVEKRQMLHSWKLAFRHPYSGRRKTFECPPPEDFETAQKRLSEI